MLISEIQNLNLQIYRNKNYSITKILNDKLKKKHVQKCTNTNDIFTDIQVTFESWVTFELRMTFELWVTSKYG